MPSSKAHTARKESPELELDVDQRRIAEAEHRLLAIWAPPGAGKTTALAARLAHRLRAGERPDRIAVMTFTREAAAHMRSVARSWIDDPDVRARLIEPEERHLQEADQEVPMWIGTIHECCARILRCHPERIRADGHITIAGPNDSWTRMRHAMEACGTLPGEPGREAPKVREALRALDRMKRAGVHPDDAGAPHGGPKRLPGTRLEVISERWLETHIAYQRGLERDGTLDLADLVLETWRLLRDWPDVRAAWRNRLAEIMIDEYQDTDALSLHIVRLLAIDGRIVACGDADQSIYRWRDAMGDFRGLAILKRTHGEPTMLTLRTDHRLPREIQTAANRLRAKLPRGGTTPNPSHRTGFAAPWYERVDDESQAAKVLAKRLREIVSGPDGAPRSGAADHPDDERRSNASDCVIVARTHRECAQLATELSTLGIPIRLGASEARDGAGNALAAWIRAACEPHDDIAVEQAFAAAPYNVEGPSLDALRTEARARGIGLWERARQAEGYAGAGDAMAQAVATLAEVIDEGESTPERSFAVRRAVERLESLTGLADSAAREGTGGEALYREIRESLLRMESEGTEREEIARGLRRGARARGTPTEAVTVETMWGVKGREWRHVFACGWTEGEFPSRTAASIDEERHVAFVTITRATRTVMAIAYRTDEYGKPCPASRFLEEAGFKPRDPDDRENRETEERKETRSQ